MAGKRTLQDLGLKGQLFGVNISIFPLYQYKEDLAFIDKHREKLEIDEELKQKIKDNYPDYSISQAYFAGRNGVESISGEMHLNKGKFLS